MDILELDLDANPFPGIPKAQNGLVRAGLSPCKEYVIGGGGDTDFRGGDRGAGRGLAPYDPQIYTTNLNFN